MQTITGLVWLRGSLGSCWDIRDIAPYDALPYITDKSFVPIATVEIPNANASSLRPRSFNDSLSTTVPYFWENSKINPNIKVVREVTKYAVKFETFLAVTWAANNESVAAKAALGNPIIATTATMIPTKIPSASP